MTTSFAYVERLATFASWSRLSCSEQTSLRRSLSILQCLMTFPQGMVHCITCEALLANWEHKHLNVCGSRLPDPHQLPRTILVIASTTS